MKIIKISALWCSACIIMNEIIEELEKKYKFELIELDYDYDEEAKNYNPGKILPVLIFLNNNIEIKRIVGERSKEELIKIINELRGDL